MSTLPPQLFMTVARSRCVSSNIEGIGHFYPWGKAVPTLSVGPVGSTAWMSRADPYYFRQDGSPFGIPSQALFPIGRAAQGLALEAPLPSLAPLRPQDMRIVALKQEARPASQGLTRLHLEMRLPCPVWGALNVTGPVSAWSLAEEPAEVRLCARAQLCLILLHASG